MRQFFKNKHPSYFFALFWVLALLALPIFTFGQASDQTIINLTVTGAPDTTAPSIPDNLVATAVSTSEISLSWDISTDNVGVVGYKIRRGGIHIATTTSASYSDTGLSAATTYTYDVAAFDTPGNTSDFSASASATTLAEVIPVTPAPSGGGGRIFNDETPPRIFNLFIQTTETTASISWETDEPALSNLIWGRNLDYDEGSLTEVLYFKIHGTVLTNLRPGTQYYLSITAKDVYGNKATLRGQSFITAEAHDDEPPDNVSNLIAQYSVIPGIGGERVRLKWDNPRDEDFEIVRIIRSERFYPKDPFDGTVIYEGSNEGALDERINKDKEYFYTAFSRDRAGNYSSGAIVRPFRDGGVIIEFTESNILDPAMKKLNLLDFDFIQDDRVISYSGGRLTLDGARPFKVSIDYWKVPEVLKTIMITLKDFEDSSKEFSFLLRVNADKTKYVAQIAPLQRSGIYPIEITVFDFKNQRAKQIGGELVAELSRSIRGAIYLSRGQLWLLFVIFGIVYSLYIRETKKKGY